MDKSYFQLTDDLDLPLRDGFTGHVRYRSGPDTAGPWAQDLQHGGPPNALSVICAKHALNGSAARDFRPVRLASDFVGPVPVADVDMHTRVIRAARTAALVEVVLAAGDRDCLHTRVWFVRDSDTADVAPEPGRPVEVPETAAGIDNVFPYGQSIEWRFVRGALGRPGPSAVWTRPRIPVLEGEEMPSLARAVLVADSGSGVSAELDWNTWSFVNVDLDVHLARPIIGDWLFMDAATQLGAHGSALARSTLSDVHGVVGAGAQTLVLARRS